MTRYDPWFLEQIQRDRGGRGGGAPARPARRSRGPARAQGDGLLRCAPRPSRGHERGGGRGAAAWRRASIRCSSGSIPARRSSKRARLICTAATRPALADGVGAECEATPSERRKVIILGGGPNRIGQGIEFDYCCVHAASSVSPRRASRPSWSTAIPRPSRPTTTPPIGCISSRSPPKTCSRSCASRRAAASCAG